MWQGVIQRLAIVQQTETRLVLRELPIFDWAIAFALVITALILSIAQFWISALIAVAVGIYFILQGRVRLIIFDVSTAKMTVQFRSPLNKQNISEIFLSEIQRAYLFKGDDAGTQIILVRVDGEEMGMSTYSNDMSPWKEDIVIAITAILHEAHKDDEKA
jgi:hypothetical protein